MRELRKACNIKAHSDGESCWVKAGASFPNRKANRLAPFDAEASNEAMGDESILTAKFPDGAPVRFTWLAELDA